MNEIEKELKRLREEMRRFWWGWPLFPEIRWPEIKWPEFREPLADIEEMPEAVKVTVELPGIAKENIDIDVTPDKIRIKAEKKVALEEKKKGYYHAERTYKGFYRELTLPCTIIPEQVTAEYKEGLLTIILPKAKKEIAARKVKVK